MTNSTAVTKHYTGIGSRTTPGDVMLQFQEIAQQLEGSGWTLRSGGANGADTAFERGVTGGAKQIYLPWRGFNGREGVLANAQQWDGAMQIASTVHPAWTWCKPAVRKLHARNVFQVLGLDLVTPSRFVLCWTPDGCEGVATRTSKSGGTATAIVLAERFAVPVINFANPGAAQRLLQYI